MNNNLERQIYFVLGILFFLCLFLLTIMKEHTTPEAITAAGTLVLALSTIMLVGVTYNSIKITKLTIQEIKEGRELSLIPVLTAELVADNQHPIRGELNTIVVKNLGNAPCLEIFLSLQLANEDTSIRKIAPLNSTIPVLGINGDIKIPFNIPEGGLFRNQNTNPSEIIIKLDYKNVYKKAFRTTIKLQEQMNKDILTWYKLEETTEIT